MIAQDRAERKQLNQLIRADLQDRGAVAPDSRSLAIRVEQDFKNPRDVAQYHRGDIIQYKQGNVGQQGISNDSAAVVVGTNLQLDQLTVQTATGDEVTYSPHLTKTMTAQSKIYREEQQEFAHGDRVRVTRTFAPQGIRRGDFGTITAMGEAGLALQLDKGSTVHLTAAQTLHIEHGYAVDRLKTGAPERILSVRAALWDPPSEMAFLVQTGRQVNVYTSDISAPTNAQKASIKLPQQQQIQAPSNVVTPEPAQIAHRHGIGR